MIDTRLEKIKKLTPDQLSQPDTLDLLNFVTSQYLDGSRIGEAKELWQTLSRLSNSRSSTMGQKATDQINQHLVDLGWLALPFLPNSMIESLFANNLLRAISLEIDIPEKVKTFFGFSYGNFSLLEQHRRLLIGGLKANQETIGRQPIRISDAGQELVPAIKHWLKDYDQSSNTKLRSRRLNLIEYINTNTNVRQLSTEEKETLRQVLSVYDFIRFLDQSDDVSETGHRIPTEKLAPSTVQKSELAPTAESESNEQQEIFAAYQGDPKQQQAILGEQEKIAKKVQGKSDQLHALFYQAVQKKNIVTTIATLRLMVEYDDMATFLQTDQKLNKFLSLTWEKQFGKAVAEEFTRNPNQPKFIQLFLRYVLEQRLGLNQNDAARVGLHIANMFVKTGKKEYNKLAYFDLKTRQFKWFED